MLENDEGATPEVEETELSMDDTIKKTLAEIEARGTEEEAIPEAEEETPEQQAKRDEKGRFASKETAPEPAAEPVEALGEEAAPVAAPTVPPEIQRLGLRKEEAEAFATASDAVKQAFIRRSEEMHRGIEQFRGKAQFGQQMEQVFTPHMQTLQNLGISPDRAVSELLQADHKLRYGQPHEKAAYFSQLAQAYGINLGDVPAPQQIDPTVYALQQQVQQLSGHIQQQQLLGQQQEQATLNSEISRFASDPKHSHFESVRGHMSALLQAGQAQTLDEAYDMAVYANPMTRAAMFAEQQAAAEAKRKSDAAKKTQEAKHAASVNVARRGAMPARKAIGTMEETIRAEAERLGVL